MGVTAPLTFFAPKRSLVQNTHASAAEDGIRLGVLEAVQFDHEADAGTVKIYTGKRH